jgi:dihydroorotate dehydrogenase (fumarate)
MIDMKVNYLGLQLDHPLIVGASPQADSLDGVRRAEDGGAAAIVFRSLFEEQLDTEAMATFAAMEWHAEMSAEATHFLPEPSEFKIGPEQYLEGIRRARAAVRIPLIGSLNGTSLGGWLGYARAIEEVGADALELNIFDVPMNERVSGAEIEQETVNMVRELRGQLTIPIAVKLSPFHTSLPHFAAALQEAGADGLVLFNRFFEPDIDIEKLEVISEMRLSDSRELLLRLRWLAILSGLLTRTQLAVTGGAHTAADAIKAVMCGASAVQVVADVLRSGPQRLREMRVGMQRWMADHEYESVESMRGCMNILRAPNANVFARANYTRILQTWVKE